MCTACAFYVEKRAKICSLIYLYWVKSSGGSGGLELEKSLLFGVKALYQKHIVIGQGLTMDTDKVTHCPAITALLHITHVWQPHLQSISTCPTLLNPASTFITGKYRLIPLKL